MRVVRRRINPRPIAALLVVMTPTLAARAADSPKTIQDYLGPQYQASSEIQAPSRTPEPAAHFDNPADRLRHWNQVAVDASGLDHTPVQPGENRVFGHQLGPGRVQPGHGDRAHRDGRRGGLHPRRLPPLPAIPSGALRVARWTPPSPRPRTTRWSRCSPPTRRGSSSCSRRPLRRSRQPPGKRRAASWPGTVAAAAILAGEPTTARPTPSRGWASTTSRGLEPGVWRQDPISLIPLALGAHWAEVRPFV